VIWLLLIPVGASALFLALRMLGHDAAKSARVSGAETAKVEAQTDSAVKALEAQGEKNKAKVMHESRDELLSDLRDSVRSPK
jgi:hypothetical protein